MLLRRTSWLLALVLWIAAPAGALAASGEVAVTIVPLHGLVAAVMEGAGEPVLIVPSNASPHTFALKPSQALALRNADLVFWAGPGVESFMSDIALDLEARTTVVALSEVSGVERLPVRKGGAFAQDGHEGDENHDGLYDAHVWLDPQNAVAMTGAIVLALSQRHPGEAGRYVANGDKLTAGIRTRQSEIEQTLRPLAERRFILFHDATQHFERRFGLRAAGTMTVNPEIAPGARRITELRALLQASEAVCVFAEPQFDRRLADAIVEGTSARVSVIDAEGALIKPGPSAYLDLMNELSASFARCLSP